MKYYSSLLYTCIMKINPFVKSVSTKITTINLRSLVFVYLLAFLYVELFIDDPIRHYNFCIFLSLSGIYFSWLIGGKRTMYYVAFFNIFLVFIFSSLLWNKGIIIHSGLFVARSFIALYIFTAVLLGIMVFKKSPADDRMEKQKKAVDEARQQRENLEFIVASRKLRQDLLAQANLVKDELQLLEGAWRSKIHDIINDLPTVKEQELYRQIMLPFQENIIRHLRDLALSLTFDLEPVRLADLCTFLADKINDTFKQAVPVSYITVAENGWKNSPARVSADKNKVWDMLSNVLRNSQAAIDMKRIELLRAGACASFHPRIEISLTRHNGSAVISIADNGGGVCDGSIGRLYHEPVPSAKRNGASSGQGTLFVKFFAERMGMSVTAENISAHDENGLLVSIVAPVIAEGA